MGIYTDFFLQRNVGGEWVEVIPPKELGYDSELPRHYGKLDQMSALDVSLGLEHSRTFTVRQDFMSPGEYAEPDEYAPWAKRGLPEDAGTEVKEHFEYHHGISWFMIDELLSRDFEKETVTVYNETKKWAEHLLPGFRIWFERLKELGVERVIYGND